jgi:hypothetical protein
MVRIYGLVVESFLSSGLSMHPNRRKDATVGQVENNMQPQSPNLPWLVVVPGIPLASLLERGVPCLDYGVNAHAEADVAF